MKPIDLLRLIASRALLNSVPMLMQAMGPGNKEGNKETSKAPLCKQ